MNHRLYVCHRLLYHRHEWYEYDLRLLHGHDLHLLQERLVACVNLVPKITSLYWWQDKIEECREALMFMKTTRERVERVMESVKKFHSYDVPEILVLPVSGGSEEYLRWIDESMRPGVEAQ